MFTIHEILVEKARSEDKMRQAEQYRLASQCQRSSRFSSFKRATLTAIGSILMSAGRRLQAREAENAAASKHQEQYGSNREIWIHTH